MLGKIITCSIKDLGNYKADYKFIITRGDFGKIDGANYLRVLAPSEALHLVNLHVSGYTDAEWKNFEDLFHAEKKADPVYQNTLTRLKRLAQKGKTICLACGCINPLRCHRSLVGNDFSLKGCIVNIT